MKKEEKEVIKDLFGLISIILLQYQVKPSMENNTEYWKSILENNISPKIANIEKFLENL